MAGANLTSADLSWANLAGANLQGAFLTTTMMLMADLSGADLRGAKILRAGLDSAILHQSTAGGTLFANCDLRMVIGLETVKHTAPSTIALDTLANSGGRIPAQFLVGAGVAEPLVAAQDVMRGERRTFPTTLLVAAMSDDELAQRLRQSLQAASIPAWVLFADDEDSLNTGEASLDPHRLLRSNRPPVHRRGAGESAHGPLLCRTGARRRSPGLSAAPGPRPWRALLPAERPPLQRATER